MVCPRGSTDFNIHILYKFSIKRNGRGFTCGTLPFFFENVRIQLAYRTVSFSCTGVIIYLLNIKLKCSNSLTVWVSR